MNGVYTRAELTAQRPLQCSACLVQEGDSVWLFVRKNGSTAVAGPDVIVTTFGSIKLHKTKLAGAINLGSANYYTKADVADLLSTRLKKASTLNHNAVPLYDGYNNEVQSSLLNQDGGNMGINKIFPEYRLDVSGVIHSDNALWVKDRPVATTLTNYVALYRGDGNIGQYIGRGYGLSDPFTFYLGGGHRFYARSNGPNLGTLTLSLDTTSRVGIRRTTPTYTLDVAGTTRVDSSTYLATLINTGVVIGGTAYIGYKLDVDGWMRTKSNTFLASDGGNVGVGTITPTAKLEIKSPSAEIVRINTSTTSQQGYIGFSENGTLKQSLGLQTDNTFFLYDNVYDRDMIKTTGAGNISFVPGSGSVGVGTTSPTTTLDVNGTAKLTPVSAATASGYTPVEGQIVIVNTTNGTFTSLGLWSYANGAWRK